MKIHFIAIGGSAMHNLAIALHLKGYSTSGSDDEIYEPSLSNLRKYGLLPATMGWHPDKVHSGLDAIILGMHARADNPELIKAKALGVKLFSYPEFLYEQSKNKRRVVLSGSHGKTTITAIVLHVLNYYKLNTDFMVGAHLDGFEVMVKLSHDAPNIILEGDEYLSSPIDPRPKFHLYRPHVALLSGIDWDHINVFPTFEKYLGQFREFIHLIEKNGTLVYYSGDEYLRLLVKECTRNDLTFIPYDLPEYLIENGITSLIGSQKMVPIQVFGRHNLLNIKGSLEVCKCLGIDENMFYEAIGSFKGARKRLQKMYESPRQIVFQDFAHAPSKLRATTTAVKEQYPSKPLYAFMELHTFSSLNQAFLNQYARSMEAADKAVVFYSPHALKMKKLPDLAAEAVRQAFDQKNLEVINDPIEFYEMVKGLKGHDACFLFMSSGTFGGFSLSEFVESLKRAEQNKLASDE